MASRSTTRSAPAASSKSPIAERGQRYRITFFPNVSADHVKALYASYQGVIGDLEGWLRNEWTTEFEPLWAEFSEAGFIKRYGLLQQADWRGFENSLNGLWDDVKQVYALIADLQANSEKLLEYLTEAELETLLNASAESIANVLLVLSDEPLMFIHLAAFTSWLRMLPPQYIAEVVAEIRTEILIGFLLVRLTGPAGLKLGMSAKVLNKIKSERSPAMAGGREFATGRAHRQVRPDSPRGRTQTSDGQCPECSAETCACGVRCRSPPVMHRLCW